MKKIVEKIQWHIMKRLFTPLLVLALFLVSYVFYRIKIVALLSEQVYQNVNKHIAAIFIICIGFIVQRAAGAALDWYRETVAIKTISRLDDELIPLIRRTLNVTIWMMALLVILPYYGVNISALVTTLGVGSLAIALAAQDTISNIIAGYMIMLDRPFRIGDKIKLSSGEIVIVQDIGIRRSKFVFEDNAIIIVPNLDLSKSKIINYTYGEEQLGKKEE